MDEPRPGWNEQDCTDWVNGLYEALAAIRDQIDLSQVQAIGVTCQRETFVLLDEANKPVRPSIIWMDTRCGDQVEQYGSTKVHAQTG